MARIVMFFVPSGTSTAQLTPAAPPTAPEVAQAAIQPMGGPSVTSNPTQTSFRGAGSAPTTTVVLEPTAAATPADPASLEATLSRSNAPVQFDEVKPVVAPPAPTPRSVFAPDPKTVQQTAPPPKQVAPQPQFAAPVAPAPQPVPLPVVRETPPPLPEVSPINPPSPQPVPVAPAPPAQPQPATPAPPPPNPFTLLGISDGAKPQVLLTGPTGEVLLAEGEGAQGFVVAEVTPSQVVLKKDHHTYKLRLP